MVLSHPPGLMFVFDLCVILSFSYTSRAGFANSGGSSVSWRCSRRSSGHRIKGSEHRPSAFERACGLGRGARTVKLPLSYDPPAEASSCPVVLRFTLQLKTAHYLLAVTSIAWLTNSFSLLSTWQAHSCNLGCNWSCNWSWSSCDICFPCIRRHLLHHCFQALMDHGVKVASVLANSFSRRCSYISESDAHVKEKAIQFGFVLGGLWMCVCFGEGRVLELGWDGSIDPGKYPPLPSRWLPVRRRLVWWRRASVPVLPSALHPARWSLALVPGCGMLREVSPLRPERSPFWELQFGRLCNTSHWLVWVSADIIGKEHPRISSRG